MSDPKPSPAPSVSAPSVNTKRVGKRLAIIREELGRRYGEADWTQEAVARRAKLTQNIIWRIEQGEGGKIENWLRLMGIYEGEGYNLNWILTIDNREVSKLQLDEVTRKVPKSSRDALRKMLDIHLTTIDEKWAAKMGELTELIKSQGERDAGSGNQ